MKKIIGSLRKAMQKVGKFFENVVTWGDKVVIVGYMAITLLTLFNSTQIEPKAVILILVIGVFGWAVGNEWAKAERVANIMQKIAIMGGIYWMGEQVSEPSWVSLIWTMTFGMLFIGTRMRYTQTTYKVPKILSDPVYYVWTLTILLMQITQHTLSDTEFVLMLCGYLIGAILYAISPAFGSGAKWYIYALWMGSFWLVFVIDSYAFAITMWVIGWIIATIQLTVDIFTTHKEADS